LKEKIGLISAALVLVISLLIPATETLSTAGICTIGLSIVFISNGRYVLIEFKLGSRGIEDGAKHLLELKQLIQKANTEK